MSNRLVGRRRPAALLVPAALLLAAGCRTVSGFLREALRERPPAPLAALAEASDARLDSLGRLEGSFLGEGTSRAVHLLSSDTGLIAQLARRYRPDLVRGGVWEGLARAGVVPLPVVAGSRRSALRLPPVRVATPAGHTGAVVTALVLHGSQCGWRGARAELVVENPRSRGEPPLRGPVLGALLDPTAAAELQGQGMVRRVAPPPPGDSLVAELLARTRLAIDSAFRPPFAPLPAVRLDLNGLADWDAADVVPYRASGDRIRYAVALRERRLTARGDTVVVTGVMAWDSAGAWRQEIFRPTVLGLRGGRPIPWRGRPLFWRRLQPISGFTDRRDLLWLEQVDVRTGRVRWGVVDPAGNVVVAGVEVEGGC